MVQGVGPVGGEGRQVLGNRHLAQIPAALRPALGPIRRNRGQPLLDVCIDVSVGHGARRAVEADDPGERTVQRIGPEFEAAVCTDDDEVAPGLQERVTSEHHGCDVRRMRFSLADHFLTGVCPERAAKFPRRVPDFRRRRVVVEQVLDGQDRAVIRHSPRPEMALAIHHVPPGPLRYEAAHELSVRAEHGQLREPEVPQNERVAGQFGQPPELAATEFPRPFPPSSPRLQVVSLLIEDPQLLRSVVADDDPPVGEDRGTEDAGKQVGFLAIRLADRDEGLRPQPPVQP